MKEKFFKILKKKKVETLGSLIIFLFSLILLSINLDFFYIKHSSSGWLPVITYELYQITEVLLYYLLLGLSLIFFLIILAEIKTITHLIISVFPIITLISIIAILIQPQLIIINPKGSSPTYIEAMKIGGYLYIIIAVIFIIFTLYTIYKEKYLKKYLQYLTLLVGALFLSSFIHENGHAFFVLISGGRITEYAPFPLLDLNNLAGYINYEGVPSNIIPLVTIGGEIFQWSSIILIGITLYYTRPNKWINTFLTLVMIIAWLDFPLYAINNAIGLPHWFIFGSSSGDIIILSDLLGIDILVFIFLAIIQLVLGLIIIYFKIIKPYFRLRNENDDKNIEKLDKMV